MSDRHKKILVTSALPYANGPIHLGHLVEYIQTDIWVRLQRMQGHTCHYVCADDAHGTAIMLKAEAEGVSPLQLIEQIGRQHRCDFDRFGVKFDNYYSTHSEENRQFAELFYTRLKQAGHITRRTVEQFYDAQKRMFLPDRFITGTCPKCHAPEQHGDNCEVCGNTYAATDLIAPKSVVSGATPERRQSEQLFFKLENFRPFLSHWLEQNHTQQAVANKQKELLEEPLLEWDISRNAPYWGFEIPDEPGKYFYVWMDAPIGYLASFKNLCQRDGLDFDQYFAADSDCELYHFIGKDIARFHTLFWPAQLHGCGFRTPTAVWCHGFLTVNGQKMSKSRGTFITAATYLQHLDPEYLRYYFAARLDSGIDDIDLNLADFMTRVNADLIGKLVNIASRCTGFINRLFDSTLSAQLPEPDMFAAFVRAGDDIAADLHARRYSKAMRSIMELADQANQYINTASPWKLIKDETQKPLVQGICTQGLNLFRLLMIYLKPVLPQTADKAEALLNSPVQRWSDAGTPLLAHRINPFTPLMVRVEKRQIEQLVEPPAPPTPATDAPADSPIGDQINIQDFAKIDLRIAKIITAERVEGADKLLRLHLDIGTQQRTIFAGIKSAYEPEQLAGRYTVIVANLAPRKMRFGLSEGMLLAAGRGDEEVFLLSPDAGAKAGMQVK